MHTQQQACTLSRRRQCSSETITSAALFAILPPGASGDVKKNMTPKCEKWTKGVAPGCEKGKHRSAGERHRSAGERHRSAGERHRSAGEVTGVREGGLNRNALVYALSSCRANCKSSESLKEPGSIRVIGKPYLINYPSCPVSGWCSLDE